MVEIERDILILISRVRCMTETQLNKVYKTKKRYIKKSFKKTLRKMCNEYTLRKYPCNISYFGYKDNSYVYYLNGGKMYKGQELAKTLIGTEIAIKLNLGGYDIKRFYRNVNVDKLKYDLFVEYENSYGELKQVLIDIKLEEKVKLSKYENLSEKIEKCSIPFYNTPKILIVTSENLDTIKNDNIKYVDTNLSKLFIHL